MAGSTKRFGARYGRRIRKKLDAIETQQKTRYKCPYCNYAAARRVAVGIWSCTKCASTFTGKAYTITRRKTTEEEHGPATALAEITIPEPQEEQPEAVVPQEEGVAVEAAPAEVEEQEAIVEEMSEEEEVTQE